MSLLSSPSEVGAWESRRGPEPPSSPNTRSGSGLCLQDIDRSFGSSMSISSLDSPRTRAQARIVEDMSDPFAQALDSRAAPVPSWLLPQCTVSRSSPHAMEISSPAVQEGPSSRPTFRSDTLQRYSVPVCRSPPDCGYIPSARTRSTGAMPSVDKSTHSEPSSPAGPPLKKRLSALYRLQRNEVDFGSAAHEAPLSPAEEAPNVSHDSNLSQEDSTVSQDDSRVSRSSQLSQNVSHY